MSTDHVFASQIWSWADPVIKRDSQGRILVVNAAFIQLYGGSVETWTGNPIQGWPVPRNVGEVSRFESRIPLPTGGETVYDWMECTLQDGTAIAMARDVTAYAAKPQQAESPAPVPAQEPAPVSEAQVQQDLASLSPLAQPQATPAAAPQPAPEPAPQTQAPATQAAATPVAQVAAVATAAVTTAAIASEAQAESIPEPVAQVAEVQPAPAPAAPAEENRDFERRPLPIEDGDAILGNNWRDAVIAKAVGVEDSTAEETNEQQAAPSAAPSIKGSGDPIKVLLAEDNAINALLTRTLLEAEGCICDVVEDGALAVEALKNNEYDMIFMDMRMPNMDGLEATRKIRSLGYGAKVLPIVALTANAFDDDRNACFDSGMNDFMTKPVSAEELSAMVKAHTSFEAEKIAS